MGKYQGDNITFNGSYYYLKRGDGAAIYRSRKEVGGVNNLVLAI